MSDDPCPLESEESVNLLESEESVHQLAESEESVILSEHLEVRKKEACTPKVKHSKKMSGALLDKKQQSYSKKRTAFYDPDIGKHPSPIREPSLLVSSEESYVETPSDRT